MLLAKILSHYAVMCISGNAYAVMHITVCFKFLREQKTILSKLACHAFVEKKIDECN